MSRLEILASDFRQTLPVIPRSMPADEVNACLKNSKLWRYVNTLKLSKNMRVHLQNDRTAELLSKQLLDIGKGKASVNPVLGRIMLSNNLCNLVASREELISKVFPDIQTNYKNQASNFSGQK